MSVTAGQDFALCCSWTGLCIVQDGSTLVWLAWGRATQKWGRPGSQIMAHLMDDVVDQLPEQPHAHTWISRHTHC